MHCLQHPWWLFGIFLPSSLVELCCSKHHCGIDRLSKFQDLVGDLVLPFFDMNRTVTVMKL